MQSKSKVLEIPESVITFVAYSEKSPTGLVRIKAKSSRVKRYLGKPAGAFSFDQYGKPSSVRVDIDGIRYNASRIVWYLFHGTISEGYIIDHLDGNPFNNKIENLECKLWADNNRNVKLNSKNTSGTKGIYERHINGFTYTVCCWTDIHGKLRTKTFSHSKYGKEESMKLCVEYRATKINELISAGHIYTERHLANEPKQTG